MKTTKIFLFILLSFFFISINFANATDVSSGVTVTVDPAPTSCVGSWSACSNGSQTYNISAYETNGGAVCPAYQGQVQGCGTPGVWSDWSGWSSCSVSSCGQTGTQGRTRSCIGPYGGGAPCVGATTDSQSCNTAACPTGSISASNCSIAQNSNSCNSSVSWSTTSPWGTSAVTTPNSITVANANSSGGTAYPVPNPDSTRTFYLYNNNTLLGQATANASCAVGIWYEGYCRVPVSGVCGSSNGMSFYVSPNSGYCSSGTYSGISGSGPWTWSCGGSYSGGTASCSAKKAVDCVGSWSDTATCSASCGGGTKQQVYTITTSASNGGVSCPYTNGATQWGGTSCNAFCCSPLYELQTVSCPAGYSGSITQERDKGAYSACLFGGWYQTYDGCTINSYTVSTSAGTGGSISPTSRTVNYGSTTTFTINPDSSHLINSVTGCGGSLSGSTYTTGAITGACTVSASFNLMTGSLTPATSSCAIALGANSCTVNLSWSTTNSVATSAVTASGMTNVNGNSGSQAFTVPYSSRTFYLYNNGIQLASASATSSCTGGTSWNGTKCAAPSGTLSASNCTIAQGASSCNTNLIWSTTDPIGTSAVTTPTGITVATANASAGTSYAVNYPSRIFYLYNNAVELKNVTATASCINGTTWDGAKCAPIIITFSAASTDIAYNTATTLNWSVANATTCTASGGWSGARATSGSVSTGNLTSRTTFTLSCTGLNGTNGAASVTVTVQSYGTLTASNCTILPAANKCNTTLVWNTYNPLATSAVTTPTNITVLSANSSAGTSYSVDYGTRDFYLYNNGVLLATATARASCEQVWDAPSGVCVTIPTLNSPVSNTVSALSAKIGATVATLGIPAVISARGVCYSSTMQNPGINNNGNGAICGKDGNNTSLGAFTIYIMKILSPNTTYYYRGYATNIAGTGYSPQGSFTTLVLPPEASIVKFKELNDKSQIDYGQSVTLIWDSSNAYYGCTMTSNFAPATDIISSLDPNTGNNNITLKPTKTTVYTLICSGEGGTSPASQVQIKVGKITPTYIEY